jgi:hypothetical protein
MIDRIALGIVFLFITLLALLALLGLYGGVLIYLLGWGGV